MEEKNNNNTKNNLILNKDIIDKINEKSDIKINAKNVIDNNDISEEEIFQQFEEINKTIQYSEIKAKIVDYGGPFRIYQKNSKSKYEKTNKKHVLSAFHAWREDSKEKKQRYLEFYYEQLKNEEINYNFKPKYLKQPTEIRNIVVMPYFLWLSWYLKNMATKDMLKKDNFDLAIELGTKWNSMLNELKKGWSELVHRDIRQSINKKGGKPKLLNKLFY